MAFTKTQQDAIDWAIEKIQSYEDERKLYNWSAILLSILDVICGVVALFCSSMLLTSVVASILCGTVWGSRFIQFVKTEKLMKSLKVLTTASFTYIMVRKRRSEFMKNIKIQNWIIAILNLAAIVLGVVLVFVQPSVITGNIEAVICGIGALLGVDIAIPCFNNAKVSPEEKEKKKELKLEKKNEKIALANIKAKAEEQKKHLLAEELEKIKQEQSQVKVELEEKHE